MLPGASPRSTTAGGSRSTAGLDPGSAVERPVYAPAVVNFIGNLVVINFGGGPGVGWIPLGPNEIWYPPYRHGPRYFHDVNFANVDPGRFRDINVTTIAHMPVGNFLNRRGATLAAASTMENSQAIGRSFRSLTDADLQGKFAHAATGSGEVPVKPTIRTAGLTPTTARQFGQVLAANGQLPGRPRAPGPQVAAKDHAGVVLGNGRSLPLFAAAQQNAKAPPQAATQNGGEPDHYPRQYQRAGRPPGPEFGGFSRRARRCRGKAGRRGRPSCPAATMPARTAASPPGNPAIGSSQNGGQRWAFLPPLQKQGQGGAQTRLQGNGFKSSWQPKNKFQGQAQTHGQATIIGQDNAGQGSKGQRWATLTPPQKQPQASRGGQQGAERSSHPRRPSSAPPGRASSRPARRARPSRRRPAASPSSRSSPSSSRSRNLRPPAPSRRCCRKLRSRSSRVAAQRGTAPGGEIRQKIVRVAPARRKIRNGIRPDEPTSPPLMNPRLPWK